MGFPRARVGWRTDCTGGRVKLWLPVPVGVTVCMGGGVLPGAGWSECLGLPPGVLWGQLPVSCRGHLRGLLGLLRTPLFRCLATVSPTPALVSLLPCSGRGCAALRTSRGPGGGRLLLGELCRSFGTREVLLRRCQGGLLLGGGWVSSSGSPGAFGPRRWSPLPGLRCGAVRARPLRGQAVESFHFRVTAPCLRIRSIQLQALRLEPRATRDFPWRSFPHGPSSPPKCSSSGGGGSVRTPHRAALHSDVSHPAPA
ncbi:hypothetical protein NDU88_006557 [Pleurodeles waltl]|uniref:Uncharacterized protein n=1 Tax=Pleurodeles waltl TaxID=8319 RepID=A0AAV7ULD5_PLEWA|nr:hypothetical protein NDU88_006557 [Pleurodeles waltl]